MSEEDISNYKKYIRNLDITKYIVLDNESNYWYSAEYINEIFKKQDKEIERLNNIINELEKVIIEFKKQIEEERKNYHKIIGNFIGKLQELKGSDK